MSENTRNVRKEKVGKVVKRSGDKTVSVIVETLKTHSRYRKIFKVSKKYLVHDDKNEADVGDKVSMMECRPLSLKKRFRLIKVIEKAVKLDI